MVEKGEMFVIACGYGLPYNGKPDKQGVRTD